MRGKRGLLPDGLGRQRPAHRAPGRRTTTASAATRRCPTTRTSSRRTKPGARTRSPISPAQLRRAVRAADRARTSRRSRSCGAASGCRSTGRTLYRTIGEHSPGHVAAGVPAQPRARRGVPAEAPTLWDVDVPDGGRAGRARGPRAARRLPPDRVPRRRRRRSFIETTRPELLPACVALVAHPDDERYQPLFGTTVRDAGVRRRGARGRAPRWPSRTRAPASR